MDAKKIRNYVLIAVAGIIVIFSFYSNAKNYWAGYQNKVAAQASMMTLNQVVNEIKNRGSIDITYPGADGVPAKITLVEKK